MKPDRNLTEASRPQQRAVFDNEKTAVSSGFCEADERARTVDLLHGKQTLYQLSYIREGAEYSRRLAHPTPRRRRRALGVELRAEQRRDVLGIRIAPEHRLREHELAVHVDVEDAVRARHDLERADDVFPVLENRRRQTGGVRLRPSGDAVLDPDVVSVGHPRRFSQTTTPGRLRRAPRSRGCRRARCARDARRCR